MSRRKPAPNDVGESARPWALSRTQWIWVALVLVATGLVFYSYELLNAAPPADRWPGYFATRPETGQLLQPLTGSGRYLPCLLPGSIQAGLITNRWLKDPGIGIISLKKRVTWVLYHSLKPGGPCAVETGDNDF